MIFSIKINFPNSTKSPVCCLGLSARPTGFMWGDTFNTFPFSAGSSSNFLAHPTHSPSGQKPVSGWLNILSVARHKSRCNCRIVGPVGRLLLTERLINPLDGNFAE